MMTMVHHLLIVHHFTCHWQRIFHGFCLRHEHQIRFPR